MLVVPEKKRITRDIVFYSETVDYHAVAPLDLRPKVSTSLHCGSLGLISSAAHS